LPRLNQNAMAQIRKSQASRIVDIPLNTWEDIGDFIGNEVRRLVRNEKVLGGSYNTNYKNLKTSGKASPSGVPQSSTSGEPDLTLTGKMLDDLRRENVFHNRVELGMLAFNIKKMEGLKRKRTGDKWDMLDNTEVLKPITNNVEKRLGKQFDKNIRKWSKDDIVIQIG